MRVLKFRAWDKTHKKMLDRVLAGPGDPCSIVWTEVFGDWVQFDETCGVIMQFTGLLDKNGVEIYEGDIVEVRDIKDGRIASKIGEQFIGRVYWREQEFQWWITDNTSDPYSGIDYDMTILENYQDVAIIGNIYKHPELLSGGPK